MKPEQLTALLKYRLEQSHETIREAEILYEHASYRGVINRAYYAMFYSVLGLLATKQLGTSKHTGVLAMFDREFVKPGIFPPDMSKSLRLAFNQRQTHDYGEATEISQTTARGALEAATTFVKKVESHLNAEFRLCGTDHGLGEEQS